jgi:hypothetical protein
MNADPPETADASIPQDPGIPGPRAPEELPPEEGPEVERVPDSDLPDYDEEGQRPQAPPDE